MRFTPPVIPGVAAIVLLSAGCADSRGGSEEYVVGLGNGVASVAAGMDHTCALTEQGTVKCWGDNSVGQLGDGTTEDSAAPVDVSGLRERAVAIAAGSTASCAITESLGVACWGALWGGSQPPVVRSEAVAVEGLAGRVQAVAVGSDMACAVVEGGTLQCWRGSSSPRALENRPGVVGITVGGFHTCALLIDGTVPCWGGNNVGQRGSTDRPWATTDANAHVQPTVTRRVTQVSAGHLYTCAVLTDGTVTCWGDSPNRDLPEGKATLGYLAQPQKVEGLGEGVEAIATAQLHACAITDRGVECWGSNMDGQLGDPNYWGDDPVVVGLKGARSVAAGSNHSCAVTAEGGVKCWGNNWSGQLGTGEFSQPSD